MHYITNRRQLISIAARKCECIWTYEGIEEGTEAVVEDEVDDNVVEVNEEACSDKK